MKTHEVKKIVFCGFGMAVVFILTAFTAIPIGQFGYVNIGDAGVMLFASVLNPALAFLVGGVGSAMADLYLGFSQYALFTFFIKGIEAIIVCCIVKRINKKASVIGYSIAMLAMVVGYYLSDVFLTSNAIVALESVGFNLMQGCVSVVIATILQIFFVKLAHKSLH